MSAVVERPNRRRSTLYYAKIEKESPKINARLIFSQHFPFFVAKDQQKESGMTPDEEHFYRALSQDYLRQMKLKVASAAAETESDWQSLRTLGNHLKGSSTMFGYPTLTELGATLEQAAEAHDNQAITATLQKLLSHLRTL
jgi:HPt (histidine-containing phosphotransfer) domain-containing protein